jgi:dTDP-4-amino-4,6-dideoxygalactose transaminase
MSPVAYLDLSRSRDRILPNVLSRWERIAQDTAFIQGPEVAAFEQAFAEFLGAPGVVGVANGTDALVVALRALRLQAGEEVLVPAFSFFATAEAVVLAGGKPVFCDVEPVTWTLDPEDLPRRRTARTVGVIGVHLYGHPFAAEVGEFCRREGLFLVEDAAQAHGARLAGARVGTLGDLAAWSFYPTKNLGAWGDAGAISGKDPQLLHRARQLANHGQTSRYHHVAVGTNSRLDSLQAAVLLERLQLLEGDNERRRAWAERYCGGLSGLGDLELPRELPGCYHVYHQFWIRSAQRDELQHFLRVQGIGTSIHYPSPLHQQPAFRDLVAQEQSLPNAEKAARELLCLPMYAELREEEVDEVVGAIRKFYGA